MKKNKSLKDKVQKSIDISNIHYNILGFNQITVLACQKEIKGKIIKLTSTDLFILKWFIDFTLQNKNGKKYIHINPNNNLEYRQIDYNMIVKSFPFLNITKQSVALIFKKFRQLKILHHFHDKYKGSYSCFRLNEKMMWILLQPQEKEEYAEKTLNNKLYTLYKILDRGIYNFIEGSIIYYRANILLENPLERNSIELSKDSKESEDSNTPFNEFIQYWNNKDIFKHKDQNTKVYKEIVKYINLLKNGLINKYCNFDIDFLKRNNIDSALLSKKWTNQEIYTNLDKVADLFVEGNWPPDKSKLPKSLSSIIFNKMRGSSFFFVAACRKEIIKNDDIVKINDNFSEITKKYVTKFLQNSIINISNKKKTDIILNVKAIVEYQKNLIKTVGKYTKHTNFSTWIGTEKNINPFIELHIDWLNDFVKRKNENPKIFHLVKDTWIWDAFIDYVEKTKNIKLNYTDQEIQKLEKKYTHQQLLEQENIKLKNKCEEQHAFQEI